MLIVFEGNLWLCGVYSVLLYVVVLHVSVFSVCCRLLFSQSLPDLDRLLEQGAVLEFMQLKNQN